MADLPIFEDLFEIAKREVLIRNPRLSRESVDRPGTDINIMLAAAAAVGDEVINQVANVAVASFLDSASGVDLDRLIFDRYGLTRKSAAPAIGSVNFTTTTATTASFIIPANTQLITGSGLVFQTIIEAVFPTGSTGPLAVPVRSILAGLNQQTRANTITNIGSRINGSPLDLTVNNPLATAGAADDEPDEEFRNRARNFFVTVRKGTIAAVEQAALAFPGITSAKLFEVLDPLGRPARVTELIVTDTFTDVLANLNQQSPSYDAQSSALADSLFNSLEDVRPAGIFVKITVATVVLIPIQLALTFDAGTNINDTELQARAAVVNYTNSLRPGENWVYNDAIDSLRGVLGLTVTGAEIVTPSGNVVPSYYEVIRSSLALTTAVLCEHG